MAAGRDDASHSSAISLIEKSRHPNEVESNVRVSEESSPKDPPGPPGQGLLPLEAQLAVSSSKEGSRLKMAIFTDAAVFTESR